MRRSPSHTGKWRMRLCVTSAMHSSTLMPGSTVTTSAVMISRTGVVSGSLASATARQVMSLSVTTPTSRFPWVTVALLLAIFKSRPSPFCILDEVDAALDEANVDRFVGVLREFQATTQFIMITHRKPSMTVADVLYGVTMEQSGVSKRMSVRFEEVGENGEFNSRAA